MNNAVFIDTVDYLDAQLVVEPNRYDVRLEFNQYIEDSREAMIDMLGKAISNKLMSIEEAVAQFYPERDEEERAVIVRDIKLQNAASMGTSMEMMLAMEVPNGIQERQTETTEEVEDPNNVSQL
jgi:hypothetical protein